MSFHLDKDEYVVFESRRSWFVLWSKTIGVIFSILIPVILFSAITAFPDINLGPHQSYIFMIFLLSWVFIVWNLIFVAWTDYWLDILIITNKNLIDIEQKGIFAREISVLQLDKIQDTTTEIHGFVATVLGYGDLRIQSAGNDKEFVLKNVDNPNIVRAKIKEAISGEVPNEEN